jgi:Bacterial tandem repeat domain 1
VENSAPIEEWEDQSCLCGPSCRCEGPMPAWQARHGLTSEQYQATFDQLVAEGYRLELVGGYSVAGQDRFAAIWTK